MVNDGEVTMINQQWQTRLNALKQENERLREQLAEQHNAASQLADSVIRLDEKVREVNLPAFDARLVERMCEAFDEHHGEDRRDMVRRMAAAMLVAADALMGPVTDSEKWQMNNDFILVANMEGTSGWECYHFALGRLFANRRARLVAPPKTAEERVRIEKVECARGDEFVDIEKRLYRDGCEVKQDDVLTYARLGLIATLKQENS